MLKPVLQKVLVACNGSQASLHAAMYAIILSKQYGCKIKAVSVVDTSVVKQLLLNKVLLQDEVNETQRALAEDADKSINEVKKLASRKGIKLETQILYGSAWSQIIKAADEFESDLILIGSTKAFSATNDIVHSTLGNHESEIIASAKCSVMVVRDKFIEQKFKLV